jgi:hypothetical protein
VVAAVFFRLPLVAGAQDAPVADLGLRQRLVALVLGAEFVGQELAAQTQVVGIRTGSSKPLAQTGTIFSITAQVPTVSTQTFWFRWNAALAMDRPRCSHALCSRS